MSALRSWLEELDVVGEPTGVAYRRDDAGNDRGAYVWPVYARGARLVAFGWSVDAPGSSEGCEGRVEVTHPQGWPWDAYRVALNAAEAVARSLGWTLAPPARGGAR